MHQNGWITLIREGLHKFRCYADIEVVKHSDGTDWHVFRLGDNASLISRVGQKVRLDTREELRSIVNALLPSLNLHEANLMVGKLIEYLRAKSPFSCTAETLSQLSPRQPLVRTVLKHWTMVPGNEEKLNAYWRNRGTP